MNGRRQKLELNWIGKDEELKLEPRILIEDSKKSYGDQGTENMLIHGDNLLALKALEQDFAGRIKCIYIDPPFNTGQAFENYDDSLEHSIWLNLMYERIKILYVLLNDNGVIWIHLDDSELHYFKVIMDEVFGRDSFVIQNNWQRTSQRTVLGQGATPIINIMEYILVYVKKPEYLNETLKKISKYFDADEKIFGQYNILFKSEGVKKLHKTLDHNGSEIRIYKHSDFAIEKIEAKDKNFEYYLENINYIARKDTQQKESSLEQRIIKEIEKNDTLFSVERILKQGKRKGEEKTSYYMNDNVIYYLKEYTKVEKGKIYRKVDMNNLWLDTEISSAGIAKEGSVEMKRNKKPELLIQRILEISSDKGDYIMDSFLGSGTTCAVANKLERKWIGIELGDHAYSLCHPRIKKVIDGSDQGGISKAVDWQGGGGFKFYELAPSLLKKDKYGQWIFEEKYNANMLAAAMCKHEGFKFSPDAEVYWKQGKSTETDYIFVITSFVTVEQLDRIHSEMKENESLLICAKSFSPACKDKYDNITIKKIPQMILGKCEFSKDNYDLNIVNAPVDESDEEEAEPEEAIEEKAKKEKKAANVKKEKGQGKLL